MLKSIFIDNYALIERLEIDLEKGLTIITGETGAGKSILLGALGLLLGKRADTSVLRFKDRKCIVEGTFGLEGYGLENYFTEEEIDYFPDTILRREIASSGKSRAFINDTPVNLAVLQELTLHLVDIHSQHQSLSLNSDSYLRWIIDAYAGISAEVREYEGKFHKYTELKKKYDETLAAYQNDKASLDLMKHQFDELAEASLKSSELAELEELAAILGNADEIRGALEGSLHAISADDSGILSNLNSVLDLLKRIKKHFPPSEELFTRAENSYLELKDIQSDLLRYSEQVETDPTRLDQVNTRIDLINTLLHKYRVKTVGELIGIRNHLDNKLQDMALGDTELEKLAETVRLSALEVRSLAETLSGKRTDVFTGFEEKIQVLLRELSMKNAEFSIRHAMTELNSSGIDKIQFWFSANKNIPLQNITRVASGGELSRLMLAIKYLISGASGLPTIIFDEIDTGVSGEIADRVGNLIKEMADTMQVLNITHLPQVASKGDHHFIVYKELAENTTKTRIRKLDDTDRLHEIARMLSGDSVSEAAIENAKVLLGK